jgi:hypothetical protein
MFKGEEAKQFRTLVMFNKFLVLEIHLLFIDFPGINV